jgi:hypothetical protein
MRTTLIEKPATLPVAWEDIQHHLHLEQIDPDVQAAEQSYCLLLAGAATNGATSILRRALIETTYETALWPKELGCYSPCGVYLKLPWPNLREILAVKYAGADLIEGTDYTILETSSGEYMQPGTLLFSATLFGFPCCGGHWYSPGYGSCGCPDAADKQLQVRFKAGYGTTPDDVPENVRAWILLRTAAMYENREEAAAERSVITMPFCDHLLSTERMLEFS